MTAYYVYMVQCSDKTFYTGLTRNLETRIKEHNEGKNGAKYTRSRRPVTLVYKEACHTISEALKREARIKQLSQQKKSELARV
ncbi:MAG: GIY-YIG nuclease family protein [Thermodesulfobacteriota bacterium]|jgi:putative endonuclease|nr:MAG: GIY-YIG nuclease family protein [Thermodesulfobacteriota bacterium]